MAVSRPSRRAILMMAADAATLTLRTGKVTSAAPIGFGGR